MIMDGVRRVEGEAGLVLGEEQGRVPDPGASIIGDGRKRRAA